MPAAGVARTNLAQLLAPPRQPGGGWLIVVLLLGLLFLSVPASCIITAVIIGLQGQVFESALASGTTEHIFAAVAGAATLASIAITFGIAQLRERSRRPALEQWNRQISRWQQSWYCHRCHTTFVAGSSHAIAPEQFGQLLTA